jgi:manganese oxidase
MFSVVKVRQGIGADDYSDPGWYENPPGTEAQEWTGPVPEPAMHDTAQTLYTPRPPSRGRT